jgi:voltage-gated potassium channel
MLDSGAQSLRVRLSGLFDDDAPRTLAVRVFNIALATLIIVNVIDIILESVSWMSQRYSLTFLTIERVATAIFVAEYLLRV